MARSCGGRAGAAIGGEPGLHPAVTGHLLCRRGPLRLRKARHLLDHEVADEACTVEAAGSSLVV
jgi:hypothetical protein